MTDSMTGARSRYSTVAIWLHWIIALIVTANLIGGLSFDIFFDSEDPAMKQLGFTIIGLHKSFGLTVIMLTLVRLGWRIANPPPPLPVHMTRIEVIAAKATHHGFYALLLLLPLSGWALVSTSKLQFPILWFGLFEVPRLPLDKAFGEFFSEGHETLAFVTIALLAVHVLAALKHHYFDRDDILARMLPFLRRTDS
jgi:cytochrome b561